MSDEVVVHDHTPGPDYGAFGPCAHCTGDAVVKVNGTPTCIPHMNEEFVGIGETVRQMIARAAALPEEK